MLSNHLLTHIKKTDADFVNENKSRYSLPEYDPQKHYLHLTNSKYYRALLTLRNLISSACDDFFSHKYNAKKIDLFMMTASVSSPMGPGSDSTSIPIKLGNTDCFLTDSSQFGFEPLLLNGIDLVYCYLPSMRGEDWDNRHLNQFFHCEAEMRAPLEKLFPIMEEYVRTLCYALLQSPNLINLISMRPEITRKALNKTLISTNFLRISFDEAVAILEKSGNSHYINFTKWGRDINAQGEFELMRILGVKTPIWVTHYDRDRVPFYQKPDPDRPDKVINSDLLFPALIETSFGGEVLGCGQRQDCPEEIFESLQRQHLLAEPYEWYINLRRQPGYQTTSGFGLGIERFLAWALCRSSIRDVIIYPRLKNIVTYP